MAARRFIVVALALVVGTTAVALASPSARVLRLDGIGPLRLGMTRQAALATGWLAQRSPGCELAGPPRPITYRLTGPRAPKSVAGTAEFTSGRLRQLSFTKGVRTAAGIEVGRSTALQMVRRYRAAGFAATSRYDSTFQGTFVTALRSGKPRIAGFATHGTLDILAIPSVSTCD